MTNQQTAGTPASQETSFGAYVSDPAVGNLTMGGSDWDGTPQMPAPTSPITRSGTAPTARS